MLTNASAASPNNRLAGNRVSSRLIPVERMLAAHCRQQRLKFTLSGELESSLTILSPEAFLPIIAIQAEMAAHQMLGAAGQSAAPFPLGTQFLEDEAALFDVFARVPPLSGDGMGSLRAVMFMAGFHRVFGQPPNRQIECEGLFDRYRGDALRNAMLSMNSAA